MIAWIANRTSKRTRTLERVEENVNCTFNEFGLASNAKHIVWLSLYIYRSVVRCTHVYNGTESIEEYPQQMELHFDLCLNQ